MITRNQAALYDVQWASIFGTNYFPLELLTGRLVWEVSEDVHIAATPDVQPTEKGPARTKYEQAKNTEKRAEFANLLGTLIEDRRKWNDYVQFKDESEQSRPLSGKTVLKGMNRQCMITRGHSCFMTLLASHGTKNHKWNFITATTPKSLRVSRCLRCRWISKLNIE